MKLLGSRKLRFFSLSFLVLVVAGVVFMALQRSGGKPPEAIASTEGLSADSTGKAADSQADSAGDKNEKGKKYKKGEKKPEPPVPVEISVAAPRDLPATFAATGSIEARRQVKLVSKASGQVVKLNVEEGRFVREGDVLLEIEHKEEALLVEQHRVQAETARRELERAEGMTDKGLGSERELEAKRELAQVNELEHKMAEVRLSNKIVRAPFSGQITLREIELGQTVNVGQSLFEIADVSPMELKLYLPEKLVGELAVGQDVDLASDVDPDLKLTGTVERIAPSVDPATSTVKVTLRVSASGADARVGSFVRARITTDVRENAISVPKKALVPEAGVTYLFVAESDTVRKVPVTTGYTDESFVEIVSGVDLGDTVVCVGQGGLRHGSKIRLLGQPPAGAEIAEAESAGTR